MRDGEQSVGPEPGGAAAPARAIAVSPHTMFNNNVQSLARYSYISGLAGVTALIGLGILAAATQALSHGWHLGDMRLTPPGNHAVFLVLAGTAVLMFIAELIVRRRIEGRLTHLSPKLGQHRWASFLGE